MSAPSLIVSGTSKECRACHRIGSRGFTATGGEQWECANDRACKARAKRRDRAEGERRWNVAVDALLNSRHCADPDIQIPFWAYVEGEISEAALRREIN